jgi:hypothetical protein
MEEYITKVEMTRRVIADWIHCTWKWSDFWCKSGSLNEIHTSDIHLKPVESSLKACGLGGKNSEAFGSEEKKESIFWSVRSQL